MPFCPNCRYEYEDGVVVCSDCNEQLVDTLPYDLDALYKKDVEWVAVRVLPGTVYAEMVQEVLDQERIPSRIRKTFMGAAIGTTGTGAISGMDTTLLVPQQYVKRVRVLLETMLDAE